MDSHLAMSSCPCDIKLDDKSTTKNKTSERTIERDEAGDKKWTIKFHFGTITNWSFQATLWTFHFSHPLSLGMCFVFKLFSFRSHNLYVHLGRGEVDRIDVYFPNSRYPIDLHSAKFDTQSQSQWQQCDRGLFECQSELKQRMDKKGKHANLKLILLVLFVYLILCTVIGRNIHSK